MEIKLRFITDEEVAKLDRLAKQRKISRQEYLRRLIRRELMTAGEFLEIDSESKIRLALASQLKKNNDLLHILITQIEERI
ncbi:ribbon-helix-helix protein, CopG family (plasmid) [Lactococcus lactis subsp. lactis]|uniref:ribbon-helix-helix protein, CopG family n=1 Tax=Lactococcus TaxID=1357 RepID=UPI002417235F|nr:MULTISPECIES: ribbon-helix-helix protein, CopG family [Lactococcus]MDG4969817.1 ribbon-helix-helix protein, CopG family [Lactococcus lactis]MDG5103653.1 ribbon-helix-helix protein, CopG family [Lactococcus lactis]MDR9868031.1 ribbon-helix-helix protein, CopG family [Lactococcus cremoris]WKB49889.1 ribbon-helix-helix protein, CopG family [Lactococcus lactis subsp. lactis]